MAEVSLLLQNQYRKAEPSVLRFQRTLWTEFTASGTSETAVECEQGQQTFLQPVSLRVRLHPCPKDKVTGCAFQRASWTTNQLERTRCLRLRGRRGGTPRGRQATWVQTSAARCTLRSIVRPFHPFHPTERPPMLWPPVGTNFHPRENGITRLPNAPSDQD